MDKFASNSEFTIWDLILKSLNIFIPYNYDKNVMQVTREHIKHWICEKLSRKLLK